MLPRYCFRCRALTALLPFVLAASAAAQPEPYVLSERVGPVIELEERTYFGLFPSTEEFSSAQAFAVGDSVEVIVARNGEPTMRATMSRATAEALGRFIETFEQHTTAFYNPNWQVVSPFVRADVPVPHVAPGPGVQLEAEGRRYRGVVLAATDSLVLLQPTEPYDWQLAEAFTVRTDAVDWVTFESQGLERFATVAPFAVAGLSGLIASNLTNIGVDSGEAVSLLPFVALVGYEVTRWLWPRPPSPGTFAQRRGVVEREASFDDEFRPFDLPALSSVERSYSRSEPAPPAPRRGLFDRWFQRYGVLSVGFLASTEVATSYPEVTYTEFFRGVGMRENSVLRGTLGVIGGIDASLRPVPWVRVGGTWQVRSDTEEYLLSRVTASVRPSALRGYVELVLPSPPLAGYRVDLAAGVGFEKNRFSVVRTIAEGAVSPAGFEVEEEQSNTYLQGTAEFFTSRYTSLFVRLTKRSFQHTVEVDEVVLMAPAFPDVVSYRMEAHEVPFEGFSELTWGMRLHF